MQPLKASKWAYGQKLFLYSAVKACMTFFTFVESRGYAFLNPNTIHKPASNNRRILIAAVFHFVAAVEEHKD